MNFLVKYIINIILGEIPKLLQSVYDSILSSKERKDAEKKVDENIGKQKKAITPKEQEDAFKDLINSSKP